MSTTSMPPAQVLPASPAVGDGDRAEVSARSRRRRLLLAVAWVLANAIPGAYMLGSHLLTRPTPEGAEVAAMGQALAKSRTPAEAGRWEAVHVLYASCACSVRVGEHLVSRRARRDLAERVLLVDHDAALEARLSAAGYRVETTTGEALKADYHVDAVPLLVVLSPESEVRYVGGYTDRKQGPAFFDEAILDGALEGNAPRPLPLFGCPANRELQQQVDPLGLQFTGAR